MEPATCFSCGGPFKEAYVTAHGQNYHPDHFRCSACAVPLDYRETNYWHDTLVYCRFHYSTRFAPKCAGCTTAVLAHFVSRAEDERWHPECYMINKLWGVKLAPPNRETLKLNTAPGQYDIEEQSYNSQLLIAEQVLVEDQVHRTWDHLSTYEISAAICLKSCVSSIRGLDANQGTQGDSELWWTKLKYHCDTLLYAIHTFLPPPSALADLQAVVQKLRDQIRYLYALCGSSSTYQIDQLFESHVIRLIHDILCQVITGVHNQNRLQRDPRLTQVFDLLLRLRQATTEQASSPPLISQHDLKAVYETPPFDTLVRKQLIESSAAPIPEYTGAIIPKPSIPGPPEIGNVASARGNPIPHRQATVVSHASSQWQQPTVVIVPDYPHSAPRRIARRRSTTPPQVTRRRHRSITPPPVTIIQMPRPRSPIVIRGASSRSSSRSWRRRSRSPSVVPVRRSRSRSWSPRRRSRSPPAHVSVRRSRSRSRSRTPPRVITRRPQQQQQQQQQSRRSSPPSVIYMQRPRTPPPVMPRPSPRTSRLLGPSRAANNPFSMSELGDALLGTKNLFSSAPSSAGALTMSIAQLCQYLHSTPHGQILSLVRRKELNGVKHEFLVMRAREPTGQKVWLRMERAAKRAPSGIRTLFSTFPARDTARICGSEDEILYEEEPSTVEAHVRFESPPSLLDLEKLLTIVIEESLDYKLWPENCFFFASVIQENLSALHGGYLVSGKLSHKNLAKDVRSRIRARVEQS